MLRFALLEAVAGGEVEEGLPGLGDGSEDEAEVGELSGAAAVFEGVEVAGLAAGAGAAQTGAARDITNLLCNWPQIRLRRGAHVLADTLAQIEHRWFVFSVGWWRESAKGEAARRLTVLLWRV